MSANMPANPETLTDTDVATATPPSELVICVKPSFGRQLTQCGVVTVLAVASYLFISHFILQSVQVIGNSMMPTLNNSGFYLLNRCIYLVRKPQPNDIVVIRDPMDRSYSVKRVVGVGGDSIYLQGGRVYVNGRELHEPYLPRNTSTFAYARKGGQFRCRPDEYFLLGDNRMNSTDSRAYGPVPRQDILGAIIR